MKKNLFILLVFWAIAFSAKSQKLSTPSFNLDFEKNLLGTTLPDKWLKWGMSDFVVQKDSVMAYQGKFSTLIYAKPDASPKSFGSMGYALPANYSGKSIRLEGYMKIQDVADGYAGIMLRIDGRGGQVLEFNNMYDKQIVGTHDWKKYAIVLPFHEDAKAVYVAGILSGKGKAWFDNFEVFIDDKNIKELQEVAPKVFKAQLDNEFEKGTTIKINSISDAQIDNLYKLGKIWGFVKYYQSDIAKGLINWDNELFRVLPTVLEAKSAEQAEKNINTWLQKVLVDKPNKPNTAVNKKELKLSAKTDWFKDKTLINSDLQALLVGFENSAKAKTHYYIDFTEGVGNPIFKNEITYNNLDYTDDGVKLLGLFRYWNMINYFFPYRHLMDEDWDKTLKTFIPKMLNADDNLSYKLGLLELIGKIQDTHANIWQKDDALTTFWGTKKAPLEVKMIENKVVVTKILDNAGLGDIKIGDVITAINNKKVEQLIEDKSKYSPASNRPTQLRNIMGMLLRTNETSLDLAIEGKKNQTVNCVDLKLLQTKKDGSESHQLLDGNIGYIYPASLKPDEIDKIMEEFKDTKGLIIDLRCYPSDFIVFSLSKYLMPKPKDFVKFTTGSLENAGDFAFSSPLKVGTIKPRYYKGKIAILINETTQSQAEYTTMALRVAPKATVIGSTTAGADGNVSDIILPGNIKTMISGIGIYYPDGKETQRIGIVPDMEVHPTIQGVKNNVDEVLNKAIEVVKQ